MFAYFEGSLYSGFSLVNVFNEKDKAEDMLIATRAEGKGAEIIPVEKPSYFLDGATDYGCGSFFVSFSQGIADGLSLTGPFPSADTALDYAERATADYEGWELFEAPCTAHAGRYLVAEGWGHIFEGMGEKTVRFVYDTTAECLVTLDIVGNKVVTGTQEQMDNVADSLVNANGDTFERPEDYGCEYSNELPDWAVGRVLQFKAYGKFVSAG